MSLKLHDFSFSGNYFGALGVVKGHVQCPVHVSDMITHGDMSNSINDDFNVIHIAEPNAGKTDRVQPKEY
jgi:hypothetical protein